MFAATQSALLESSGSAVTSRRLYIGDLKLNAHVLESSRGSPVVLCHGAGAMAASWVPLLGLLAPSFSLRVPDLPGFGLTDKVNYRGADLREFAVRYLESLLGELGAGKVAMVGNSVGGFWSIAFTLAHPERVNKLVLIGAPAGIDRWVPLAYRLLGTRFLNTLLYSTIGRPTLAATRALFRRYLVADIDRVSPEYLRCAHLSAHLPGAKKSFLTLLEQVVTLSGFRRRYFLRGELMNIVCPTLFVWGDKDAFAPPSSGERACRAMPDARIVVVKDAGHLPWLDQPEQCADAIRGFLGGTNIPS